MRELLDTHVWIWWLTGQSRLPESERDALDTMARSGHPPGLSAISLWEAQMLYKRGRLELDPPFSEWLRLAADPGTVCLLPLDTEVLIALEELPESFHGDPADRIIVATAICHRLRLRTHDRSIRQSQCVNIVD